MPGPRFLLGVGGWICLVPGPFQGQGLDMPGPRSLPGVE